MGYTYTYPTTTTAATPAISGNDASFVFVAFILALAAAIVLYFVFLKAANDSKLNGFAKKLYDFLHFRKFIIVDFVKIAYMFTAIFITLFSLYMLTVQAIAALVMLVVGNVIARICYEAFMVMYSIFENTREINKKMK